MASFLCFSGRELRRCVCDRSPDTPLRDSKMFIVRMKNGSTSCQHLSVFRLPPQAVACMFPAILLQACSVSEFLAKPLLQFIATTDDPQLDRIITDLSILRS